MLDNEKQYPADDSICINIISYIDIFIEISRLNLFFWDSMEMYLRCTNRLQKQGYWE